MIELVFLIIFPVIVALLLLLSKNVQLRNFVVKVAAVLIGGGTLILLVTYFSRGMVLFSIPFEPAAQLMFILELLIALFLLYLGIKHRKYIAVILVTIQTLLLIG
ncbi:MAG: NADH-quinone oxidoreductase subunit L, partial [Methanoregulaceae archaeon]|nr:NADH-quinone oxidoreductase subunit L [Methanoregulaceae archaeon]